MNGTPGQLRGAVMGHRALMRAIDIAYDPFVRPAPNGKIVPQQREKHVLQEDAIIWLWELRQADCQEREGWVPRIS